MNAPLIQAKKRPALKDFSVEKIIRFRKEKDLHIRLLQDAGVDEKILSIEKDIQRYLTWDQRLTVARRLDKNITGLVGADVDSFLSKLEEIGSRVTRKDPIKLLKHVRLTYADDAIRSVLELEGFLGRERVRLNIDEKALDTTLKEGRKTYFKLLAGTLPAAFRTEFEQFMRRTEMEGTSLYKDPKYHCTIEEFQKTVERYFNSLFHSNNPPKIGTVLYLDGDEKKKKKTEEKGSKPRSFQRLNKDRVRQVKVRAMKRKAKLQCWNCQLEHHLMDCPSLNPEERREMYLKKRDERKAQRKS